MANSRSMCQPDSPCSVGTRQADGGDILVLRAAGTGAYNQVRKNLASFSLGVHFKLAQKLGKLQTFTAVFPQECMGQLASFCWANLTLFSLQYIYDMGLCRSAATLVLADPAVKSLSADHPSPARAQIYVYGDRCD